MALPFFATSSRLLSRSQCSSPGATGISGLHSRRTRGDRHSSRVEAKKPALLSSRDGSKECLNYHTIALISHASKVMLKILQARLQQYVNRELPDVQAGFIKGRGTRDQIANIRWIMEKSREFQKNIYFCFIDYAKAFDCVDHNQLWKILTPRFPRHPEMRAFVSCMA